MAQVEDNIFEDPSELPRNSLFFLEDVPEVRGTILSNNMEMPQNADYMRMTQYS